MRSKRWIQESRGGIQESKEGRGRNVKQLKKISKSNWALASETRYNIKRRYTEEQMKDLLKEVRRIEKELIEDTKKAKKNN